MFNARASPNMYFPSDGTLSTVLAPSFSLVHCQLILKPKKNGAVGPGVKTAGILYVEKVDLFGFLKPPDPLRPKASRTRHYQDQ